MPSPEAPTDAVERVAARVRAWTSMRLGPAQRVQLAELARARAEARGISVERWAEELERLDAAPELDALLLELTVGETHLFRGPIFEVLDRHVLPELCARKLRDGSRALRIASVGCATGEEVYSLAACALDAIGDDPGFLASVLGLDVNPRFLERAERGRYSRWSLRDADMGRVGRFLTEERDEWVVRPELRALARFQLVNLARDAIPSPGLGLVGMDLVVCQNVLIYLEPAARARVVEGLCRSLAPGGIVFFGPSDLLGSDVPAGSPQRWGDVVGYRRAEGPSSIPRRSSRPVAAVRSAPPASPRRAPTAPPTEGPPRTRPPAPIDPALPPPTYERASALADAGDVDEALAELEAWLTLSPEHAQGHALRGLLLTDDGDAAEALVSFRRALYIDPTQLLALGGAIAASRKLGRRDLVQRYAARLRALSASGAGDRPVEGWEGMTVARLLQLARGERGGS